MKSEALKKAETMAAGHVAKLEDVARAFARGKATTEELLDAAKKATNANHAVGRAKKAER